MKQEIEKPKKKPLSKKRLPLNMQTNQQLLHVFQVFPNSFVVAVFSAIGLINGLVVMLENRLSELKYIGAKLMLFAIILCLMLLWLNHVGENYLLNKFQRHRRGIIKFLNSIKSVFIFLIIAMVLIGGIFIFSY